MRYDALVKLPMPADGDDRFRRRCCSYNRVKVPGGSHADNKSSLCDYQTLAFDKDRPPNWGYFGDRKILELVCVLSYITIFHHVGTEWNFNQSARHFPLFQVKLFIPFSKCGFHNWFGLHRIFICRWYLLDLFHSRMCKIYINRFGFIHFNSPCVGPPLYLVNSFLSFFSWSCIIVSNSHYSLVVEYHKYRTGRSTLPCDTLALRSGK